MSQLTEFCEAATLNELFIPQHCFLHMDLILICTALSPRCKWESWQNRETFSNPMGQFRPFLPVSCEQDTSKWLSAQWHSMSGATGAGPWVQNF